MIRKNYINRDILLSLFTFFSVFMIAIGSFYDERLELFGINISIICSSIFLVLSFSVLILIKSIRININKSLFYVFFSALIISNLALWALYGATDYGIEKFLNFVLIPLPISIVVIEKFKIRDKNLMINILLVIAVFLFVLTMLSLSTLSSTRSGVLGGGPIVLSRWLCLGAVIVLFHPKIKRLKVIYILLFLLAALFTGSRGPLLSFSLVLSLYFFLNFRRVFFKVVTWFSFLFIILFASGTFEILSQYKTVSRVFMNVEEGGLRKSTGRSLLFESSVQEIIEYPLGVGSGNFVEYTEKSIFFKNKELYYPHNLFFEIVCEYGILTFLFFLGYLIHSIYLSFKINLMEKLEIGNMMFYTFVFLFLNSMISGDLNDARLLFVFIPLMLVKENE